MPKINVLPKHLAELIAAGEVVERPSSAVKELMENSIDAGATKITVEIKNGGIRYIRITDDGCGIAREDVPNAFISHATSKIKVQSDLNSIFTLGFRGEALASVAAVSHVELLTKTAEDSIGTRYVISAGVGEDIDDAGCPDGTTIIIRDLFYNTPARMKFLKKDMTEGNYVSDVVSKIALSHPEVGVTLIKDNKRTLFTPGDSRLMSVINEVYGREFGGGLIPCDGNSGGVKVSGYISKPVHSRPNRAMQHIFVNGRYIKLPVASSALDNAYKNSVMTGKYPACVLFLEVDPRTVDVNVHPAKTQVRFSDEKSVYDAIYFSAVSSLQKKDTPVQVSLSEKPKMNVYAPEQKKVEQVEMPPVMKMKISVETEKTDDIPPVEKMYKGIKKDFNPQAGKNKLYMHEPSVPFFRKENEEPDVLDMKPEPKKEVAVEEISQDIKTESIEPKIKENSEIDFRVIGEVFGTYILVEEKQKLLFVDKHAAHERILFNKLKKEDRKIYSQLLLSPVTVTLSKSEYSIVVNNLDIFEKSGYLIEDFGEGTVRVRECPTELSDADVTEIVLEMADKLAKRSSDPEPEKLDWLYHSTACRAAIKAGDRISVTEMESLVKTVLTDNDVRYCPHGRPVMFEMTEYEMKKLFGRNG